VSARRSFVVAALAFAPLASVAACIAYDATEVSDVAALKEDFAPVSEMLGTRCGSLDCHGSPARPLRLYHHQGMRRAKGDVPGGDDTRQDEHDANFLSVTGLEPELIAEVADGGGEGAEGLVLHGKAYGLMKHDGGEVLVDGTNAARCFTSWLAGRVEVEACDAASTIVRPGAP
jgi:hypothetical protein